MGDVGESRDLETTLNLAEPWFPCFRSGRGRQPFDSSESYVRKTTKINEPVDESPVSRNAKHGVPRTKPDEVRFFWASALPPFTGPRATSLPPPHPPLKPVTVRLLFFFCFLGFFSESFFVCLFFSNTVNIQYCYILVSEGCDFSIGSF